MIIFSQHAPLQNILLTISVYDTPKKYVEQLLSTYSPGHNIMELFLLQTKFAESKMKLDI